jgi:hypothetical protein
MAVAHVRSASARAVGVARPRTETAAGDRPAFSLASSQIFTSKDTPAIYLTFRRVSFLDFRVYASAIR